MNNKELNREISIIYDLLFGYTDKMQNLREELDEGNFNLPVEIALVLKLSNYNLVIKEQSKFRREEIRRQLINQIKTIAARYCRETLADFIEENIIVLFFAPDFRGETDLKEGVLEFGSSIKERLEEETDFSFAVGVGRRYTDLKGLIFSYKEAMNACTTGHFQGKNVTHIDDIVQLKKEIPIFISRMEEELLEHIRGGDLDEFINLFREIVNTIIEERLEPEIIKTRVMELYFRVLRQMENSSNYIKDLAGYLEKILEVETGAELIELTDDISDRFFTLLQRNKRPLHNKEEINRALQYIEEYYQHDLTLEETAEEAGLSIYYFSHLFKEEVGETFVTYLNKLRVSKARQLLVENKLNIAEICYRVGYNDPNYFTRVFKEYEDMTPSEYRKKKGEQDIF